MITSALIVRDPWIGYILAGQKVWEMRKSATIKRETIGLIRKGSGLVVGTARIVDSLTPLSRANYMDHRGKHAIPAEMLDEVIENGWVHPWVLTDAKALAEPVPYDHRSGAVTFVTLKDEVTRRIGAQESAVPVFGRYGQIGAPDTDRTIHPTPERQEPQPSRPPDTGVGHVVYLTAGNVNNGHFYLRSVEHLIPVDGIGGANKEGAGSPFTVHFSGETFETDVAGDKMILRKRLGATFRRLRAEPGDRIRIDRTGPREWNLTLEKSS